MNFSFFKLSPTPRVEWRRENGNLPERSRVESFGQELVVENIQYQDAGGYECEGINDEAQVPIRRSFDLVVECRSRVNRYCLHFLHTCNINVYFNSKTNVG